MTERGTKDSWYFFARSSVSCSRYSLNHFGRCLSTSSSKAQRNPHEEGILLLRGYTSAVDTFRSFESPPPGQLRIGWGSPPTFVYATPESLLPYVKCLMFDLHTRECRPEID